MKKNKKSKEKSFSEKYIEEREKVFKKEREEINTLKINDQYHFLN